jgi:hypothetical protein
MRRIVHLLAVLGAVALTACTGGGSVLNLGDNSQPDRTVVTVDSPLNIARVLPGASLAISATTVKGSQNGTVNVNRFVWSAVLLTSGQYIANSGGQTKACGSVQYSAGGAPATALTEDMSIAITIDPTNESNIIFTPPAIFPLPSGAPAGSSVTPSYPYCVVVTATPLTGGTPGTPQPAAAGSIIVAVVNPQAPLQ